MQRTYANGLKSQFEDISQGNHVLSEDEVERNSQNL